MKIFSTTPNYIKFLKRIPILILKWVSNKLGYKSSFIKISNGVIKIEGDRELLKYVDISGYSFKKKPLNRLQPSKAPQNAKEMFLSEPKPDVSYRPPIKKLTKEQLKEIGLV
jgi:hypothetical protein